MTRNAGHTLYITLVLIGGLLLNVLLIAILGGLSS